MKPIVLIYSFVSLSLPLFCYHTRSSSLHKASLCLSLLFGSLIFFITLFCLLQVIIVLSLLFKERLEALSTRYIHTLFSFAYCFILPLQLATNQQSLTNTFIKISPGKTNIIYTIHFHSSFSKFRNFSFERSIYGLNCCL